MKVDAVFFDATTIYFESQKMDEFRKFGYSKDGKYGEVQIVIGLLMDQDGRPIGIEFYPGNTFDGHTLKQGLESLKNKFSINEVIIIADRGMCSYENLKAITDLGMDYIIGSTLKRKTAALKKDILDIASYEDVLNSNDEVFKYKEISIQTKNDDQSKEAKKERLIVTWSQARAKRDAKNREILIEKANKIASGEESVKKPGKARYLKSSKEETKYEVDQEKIKRDEKWDGFYGIQTSCKNKTKEEVYSLYRKLWKIEDCFRMLKSHLELRPVYHWNEDRIKGHLVLCFLTFVLERHLEITAKGTGLQLSPLKIRELIAGLEASLVTIENQKFLLRAAIPEDAKKLLKVFSIQEPSNLTLAKEF
jgi:transposase